MSKCLNRSLLLVVPQVSSENRLRFIFLPHMAKRRFLVHYLLALPDRVMVRFRIAFRVVICTYDIFSCCLMLSTYSRKGAYTQHQ